ncbi:MAG: hypothetical protein JHD28_01895 [Bacteroidia bacterium]|nr:hypothetical protein [Bacteroidia bacterium]
MTITKPIWLKIFFIRFNNIDKSNKFIRNAGFIWTAVVLFFFIPEELINLYVSENGIIVNATITEMPDNCGGKYMYANFELNNKVINKRVGKLFCNDNKLGDYVPMYFHPSFPNNSLLETERGFSIKIELFACFVLLLFGMLMIKYAYKSS